jgi:hypothetical protein
MIDDMASLKQAMEQMDAEDATVAQAAKDRAAQILSDARLSFAKLADAIEQQRLLLRPRIVASIKRMDQPASLGDAAFRDTGASLRKEGQSFRQIAEALEMREGAEPRYERPMHRGLLTQIEEPPEAPEEKPGPPLILQILSYPFRHPVQILAIAVLAVMLANGVREFASNDHPTDGRHAGDTVARQHADAVSSNSQADQPSSAAPSTGSANPSANATSPAMEPAPAAPASPPATSPQASTPPRPDGRSSAPSTPAGNDHARTDHRFGDFMPAQLRRRSRLAGPCRSGIGGCYWGGGQY